MEASAAGVGNCGRYHGGGGGDRRNLLTSGADSGSVPYYSICAAYYRQEPMAMKNCCPGEVKIPSASMSGRLVLTRIK